MTLSAEERALLERMADEVHETRVDIANVNGELIRVAALQRSHSDRLDRHDWRIGTLERVASIGPVGTQASDRARHPMSLSPQSPSDLGFRKATESGTEWKANTPEIERMVRMFQEQEAERRGAEEALAKVRESAEITELKKDRTIRRLTSMWPIAVSVVGAAVYALTHFLHL